AARDNSQTPGRNFDQLRIRQVHEKAVISYGGKIRALSNFLCVLLLLDLVASDADVVIVLKRQLDGLLQSNMPRQSGVAGLLSKNQRTGERQGEKQELVSWFHDFTSTV